MFKEEIRVESNVRHFSCSPLFKRLGGIAKGTVRAAASRSRLPEYPLTIIDGFAHVEAVSKALATFGHEVRQTIEQAAKLADADTADIFTKFHAE